MSKNIRILYKKQGQVSQIKFITDIFEIKKLIVKGDLKLVKFEDCIIVCNKDSVNKDAIPNIVLDFKNVCGDLFLIGYNAKAKDFRSLNTEEIIFYADSLNRKSFNYKQYEKWLKNNKLEKVTNSMENEKNNGKENKIGFKIAENSNSERLLGMILNIQAVILKCIKNMNNEE